MSSEVHRHYRFIIVIPVADRPRHLQQCLHSLQRLSQVFGYAPGLLSVLVADDSADPGNIARQQRIIARFSDAGMAVEYFGLAQQQTLLESLDQGVLAKLRRVLGDCRDRDGVRVRGHKGASRMRNLACLRLVQRTREDPGTLIHFIDSDQEFQVRVLDENGPRDGYRVDYYRNLERIFQDPRVKVLTGKVVGDPPVSPAVMAANFLADVVAFLGQLAERDPRGRCEFHDHGAAPAHDAAYHDMAQLFGFSASEQVRNYRCPLSGVHDHRDCAIDLAARLDRFFHGEHPSRASYFTDTGDLSRVTPARTVYTGNYVLRPQMLRYFNPFASLGLRMIGPSLGRILRAELGTGFVSANLPLLHKRTLADTGSAEYRPGVESQARRVQLAGEIERQFYGDILLFSVQELTGLGPLPGDLSTASVRQTVEQVARQMSELYLRQHLAIADGLARLEQSLLAPGQWWVEDLSMKTALAQMRRFMDNIHYNFSDDARAWRSINDAAARQERLNDILAAILAYADDRHYWERLISS